MTRRTPLPAGWKITSQERWKHGDFLDTVYYRYTLYWLRPARVSRFFKRVTPAKFVPMSTVDLQLPQLEDTSWNALVAIAQYTQKAIDEGRKR